MPEVIFITKPPVICCYHLTARTTFLREENFITRKAIRVFSHDVLLTAEFLVAFKTAEVLEMPVTALCLRKLFAENELGEDNDFSVRKFVTVSSN